MHVRTGFAIVALGVLATSPVAAQTATSPEAPQGATGTATGSMRDGRSENLSKKLSRTNGVIAPGGNVDPGMATPAPDPQPHSTPVIPPSATGGDTAK